MPINNLRLWITTNRNKHTQYNVASCMLIPPTEKKIMIFLNDASWLILNGLAFTDRCAEANSEHCHTP